MIIIIIMIMIAYSLFRNINNVLPIDYIIITD